MVGVERTLTWVPGVAVGHAGDPAAATGCTVIVGPFRAAVEVRGLATGSRELDALSPLHLVPRADAVMLTGGSAFGLSAADGVMAWLEERGRGFDTGHAVVPIVPSAVIYDLGVGDPSVRPDLEMGRAAAADASESPVSQGRIGAGTGATVGKLRGPDGAEPGGVGSWATGWRDHRVGALAVVNAFGDVVDEEGDILAGCRAEDGSFLDTAAVLRQEGGPRPAFGPGENTTLAAVVTDLPLTRRDLQVVARQAMNGIVRRISPSGTVVDGDMAFALSTGGVDGSVPGPADQDVLMGVASAAQEAVERAVVAAVRRGGEDGS